MSYLESVFGLDGIDGRRHRRHQRAGSGERDRRWRKAGAKVVVSGRDRQRGESVVAEIADAGGSAELELADVSRRERRRRVRASA